jgi:hypothetical protein
VSNGTLCGAKRRVLGEEDARHAAPAELAAVAHVHEEHPRPDPEREGECGGRPLALLRTERTEEPVVRALHRARQRIPEVVLAAGRHGVVAPTVSLRYSTVVCTARPLAIRPPDTPPTPSATAYK